MSGGQECWLLDVLAMDGSGTCFAENLYGYSTEWLTLTLENLAY